MDRNANAAPSVEDGQAEPYEAGQTQIRSRATGDVVNEAGAKPLLPGTCVAGKYIICDVLGTGGAAVVYAAEQVGLKRVVAFKLYPVAGPDAAQLRAQFEREAQLLARVYHENVVAVFDAGSMPDGSPYLVVQRLRGDSLATRLLSGPLPLGEALDYTRQTLNALVALADAGITHRDVKPGNLVLDRDADGHTILKLVDFGIAKQTDDEVSPALDAMVGTPHYMAPEQVRGEGIDPRADLYALGATLYEMLTGRTPYGELPDCAIALATLSEPIAPVRALRPDCPDALEQLVMRALAKDPADRFASARDMRSALELCQPAAEETPVAPAPGASTSDDEDTLRISTFVPTPVTTQATSRRRLGRALGGVALVASLALAYQLPAVRQFAPQLEASESSLVAPLVHTGAAASELAQQTGARAVALLGRLHTAAQELIETVQNPSRAVTAPVAEP